MTASPVLSVVLPCRNQADHIGDVLKSYLSPLEATGRSFELIAVPNDCADSTVDRIREIARSEPRLRVVELSAKGWGRAVKAGLDAAVGELLCYTNSARTDPRDVARLLDVYFRASPCVAKVRRIRRHAATRELGSWLYNLEGRLLFGITVRDVNGTPKLLSRETYRRLSPSSPGDLFDLELIAAARRARIPVVELEVEGFSRHGGRSSTNMRSALRMYAGAAGLRLGLSRGRRPSFDETKA